MAMERLSERLAVAWSEELESALSGAAPMTRHDLMALGWLLSDGDRPYRGEGERYVARWDAEACDGGRLRALCRDFGEAGRSAPPIIRALGRLFEWDGNAILTGKDDKLDALGHGWAFGSEFKLVRDVAAWSAEKFKSHRMILDLDDESWALAAKERWELERLPQASISAPKRSL